jgi:NhaP-type Na+/H+ or K+/H+ antiporter
MALSLPEAFPERALLQQITFGVVLFTLFVQGTTAELVVRRTRAGAEVASAA